MTLIQQIITIASIICGTVLTRFFAFLIFPERITPPNYIKYLGYMLPSSIIGMLIIYCLKDSLYSQYHCIPETVSILFIIIIHKWKNNTLLSIALGTIFYMIIIQQLFISNI